MSNETTTRSHLASSTTTQEHAHALSPLSEQSFTFVTQRWKRGLAVGAGAVAQLGLGLFLLSQIEATPGLRSQLAVLGSVFCICGAAFLVSAIRDLFGRLVVDDTGVSISPSIAGFNITWDQIERCEVKEIHSQHAESPYILFWIKGSVTPLYIPYGWLSGRDRHQIQQVLQARVPSRALAAS